MERQRILELLARSESFDLDWKAAFPKGLSGGRSDPEWESGKGTVLRDLVAIANVCVTAPGYLIYGVKDEGITRRIVGILGLLDDADFQTWVENAFDPPVRFNFSNLEVEGKVVGVFEIYPDPSKPHVAVQGLGGVLHPGQVWFRRGTKNTVALREDLQRFLGTREPLRAERIDSSLVSAVSTYYQDRGYRTYLARLADRDGRRYEGWLPAKDPETGREIIVGNELILLAKPNG